MARRALIIGATGLVAPALSAKLRSLSWQVLHAARSGGANIHFDLAEPDLKMLPRDVDAVFLIAADTSLRRCEEEPERTAQVNVLAPARIARHYAASGAHVLTLSTNLVFDGAVPFASPSSERRPICVYGKQKARLEDELAQWTAPVTILRITKIVESLKPLVTDWSRDLAAGKPIKPFRDLVCAPVGLARVVDILAHAAARRSAGIFQHGGDRDIDYAEIARILCRRMKVSQALIEPCHGADLPLPPVALPRHTTLAEALPPGFVPQGPENILAVLGGFFDRLGVK